MKRILAITVCFLLLAVGQAEGQNSLSVAQFREIKNSTAGFIHATERFDRNGEKCAVIRVVRPRPGFIFDTGLMQLVHQEDPANHLGETWLWVSPMLRHISISHNTFGRCQYEIPIAVEGGRTYEMMLDIGTGRFVNITTTRQNSAVVIDGQEIGRSPIYNYYLDMGVHQISATNNKHEGSVQRTITTADVNGLTINVTMKDLSHLYGDVVVKVDGGQIADIFYQGRKVETATWHTQLKEGTHTIETRKADCDPQATTFQVVAGKENHINAIPPVPHTGYLQVYTRPRSVRAILDGSTPIDLSERQVVPVGGHQLLVQHKGYKDYAREYHIERYATTKDTIQLERIKYVKPLAFYFGGGYSVSTLSGITAMLGAVVKSHDVQLSYTFGTSETDDVFWYGNDNKLLSATRYKQNAMSVKYGYQFDLLRMLAITPQVGYTYGQLKGSLVEGSGLYADNASIHLATVGVKLLLVPLHHLYVFAAPQYAIAVGKSDGYDRINSHSDVNNDGFSATLGLLLNF